MNRLQRKNILTKIFRHIGVRHLCADNVKKVEVDAATSINKLGLKLSGLLKTKTHIPISKDWIRQVRNS